MGKNIPEYIIIHHAGGNIVGDSQKIFEAVSRSHISRGWGEIGYHWFIERDGLTVPGRAEDRVGAHAKDSLMNFKSIGICLAGNFERQHPTESQLRLLELKVHEVMNRYNIPPGHVLGHRDPARTGTKTVCPGANLPDSKIRKIAFNKLDMIPEWKKEFVERAKELGISNGERPMDTATRGEVMGFTLNLLDYLEKNYDLKKK